MTYLGFHAVFLLPPIVLLAAALARLRPNLGRRAAVSLPLVALIAFVYTTPWDNYLVWRGVWSYGADRVVGTIGYVPVEEYLFFLLQPLLTGLWLYLVMASARAPRPGGAGTARWVGTALFAAASVAGVLLLRTESGTYLGLILAWAAPVLALQWAYGGAGFWARRREWLLGWTVPTAYLWIADATAIHLGIWEIAERYTLGPALGPLPLEEAAFFLVTNLLCVQGLQLFVHPPVREAAGVPAAPAVQRA